jgi:spore maturation protein SpmB
MNESSDEPSRVFKSIGRGAGKGLAGALLLAISAFSAHALISFGRLSGVVGQVLAIVDPVAAMAGLPGEALFVFGLSMFFNFYAALGALAAFGLGVRDTTIITLMCLLAHNLAYESALMKKTGSAATKMLFMRIGWALAAGWLMNVLLAADMGPAVLPAIDTALSLFDFGQAWIAQAGLIIGVMAVLLALLRIMRALLEEFGIIIYLSRFIAPFLKFFGLPAREGLPWLLAALSDYKGACKLMDARIKDGAMKKQEADLFNHHAALCHGILEDSALAMILGLSLFWLILPRLAIALVVVWVERVRRHRFRRSFRVGTA